MEEGKDGGWIKELGDTTAELKKRLEEHEGIGSQLIRVIPILIEAVINLEKRVSALEIKEEIERIIERGG